MTLSDRTPMTRGILFLVVAVAMELAFASAGAYAVDGVREAKGHADRALRQYNLGNFDEAIKEFGKAYEIDPSPIFLFNLGQAQRHLGDSDRAIFFFRRYLNETLANAPSRDEAERYIQELEERIAAEKAAKGKPPAAAPVSAAPVPSPTSSTESSPSPASGTAKDSPSQVSPVLTAPPPRPAAAEPEGSTSGTSASDGRTSTKRTLAWVAGGVAVVSLATAVVFQLGASGKLSQFNTYCRLDDAMMNKPVSNPDMAGRDQGQCATLYNDWQSGNRWALAGYLTGAAFAVTSILLFVTSRSGSSDSGVRAHVDCRPGPGTVLCGGVF